MVILREITKKYKDYYPEDLSKWSKEKICVSCDNCGLVRWIRNDSYRTLCTRCAHIGKKYSDESKAKMSKAKIGNKNCLGYKHTKETKLKVSKSLIGNTRTLGYKHTEEAKQKISDFQKGKIISDETKEKMSKANKGRIFSEEHKINLGLSSKGRKHSQETKDKWSKDRSGIGNSNYGKFGKDASGWKGGTTGIRDHVLPINQCLQINKRFIGSHAHHISADVVIFIPEKLHRHISHSLKDGKNMYEMNMLSLQYLRGWL